MMERGHKIKSVHNIDFDTEEIFEMIETWLPLFLTGQVEAHYLTALNRSLFSEFMGAAGNCSVRFATLRGGAVSPRAFLSESGEEAAFVREQIEELASYSKPLVTFFRKEDAERLYSDAEDSRKADGDVIKLTRRPTLESMPGNLAVRIFSRVTPSRKSFELLMHIYSKRRAGFLDSLAHVAVTEIFPLLPTADIASGAASAAVEGWLLSLVHVRRIRRAYGGSRPTRIRANKLPPRIAAVLSRRPDSERGGGSLRD